MFTDVKIVFTLRLVRDQIFSFIDNHQNILQRIQHKNKGILVCVNDMFNRVCLPPSSLSDVSDISHGFLKVIATCD